MKKREVRRLKRLVKEAGELLGLFAESSGGLGLHRMGEKTEREFVRMSESRGLPVEHYAKQSIAYDFVVAGLRVQVKTRKVSPGGIIKLCSTRRSGALREGYYIGEFDVLAVKCDGVWYLIPETSIETRGEMLLNNIVIYGYSEFIDNWGVFTDTGVRRHPSQLLLELGPH
jgi:hypothetical protein